MAEYILLFTNMQVPKRPGLIIAILGIVSLVSLLSNAYLYSKLLHFTATTTNTHMVDPADELFSKFGQAHNDLRKKMSELETCKATTRDLVVRLTAMDKRLHKERMNCETRLAEKDREYTELASLLKSEFT